MKSPTMNRTDLATVALGALLLQRLAGIKLYVGASAIGGTLAAARAPDAPPTLRALADLMRRPAVSLLGEPQPCCEGCASGGGCDSDKSGPIPKSPYQGKSSVVFDADWEAVQR